jgi:Uma2 family endonuclease
MMASHAPPATRISPEEFLAMDREAEFKSEYYDGEIVAMSGASLRHNRIVANLVAALHGQLRRGPCQVFPSAMRVWNPVRRSYTFPDVVVVCGRPEVADGKQDVLLNPTLLIEVLSDSTQARDRGQKSEGFRRLTSPQEYLLVAQHEVRVERYRRYGEKQWMLTEALDEQDVLELDSIGCTLALSDVYENALGSEVERVAAPDENHG